MSTDLADAKHIPVLLEEVLAYLQVKEGGVYVDCTVGAGGHCYRIAEKVGSQGRVIGIDRDQEAIEVARKRLSRFLDRVELVRADFRDLRVVLDDKGVSKVDGFLFDLGVSSLQLDNAGRGFSYMHSGPLDMRMDQRLSVTAYDLVNQLPEDELARIIELYGEERWAKRIARQIALRRNRATIATTKDLVDIIKEAIPARARRRGPHPAKRTFQALRIAVNQELDAIPLGLQVAVRYLALGGRICVISFHSLEDRIVKRYFQELSRGAAVEPLPGLKMRMVTKKAIRPQELEAKVNPRARSARLRVIEKVEGF